MRIPHSGRTAPPSPEIQPLPAITASEPFTSFTPEDDLDRPPSRRIAPVPVDEEYPSENDPLEDDLHELDIWGDLATLTFLQTGSLDAVGSMSERRRIRKRARSYEWSPASAKLWKHGIKGRGKEWVPHPEERPAILQQFHDDMGHYGVRRTYDLVSNQVFWSGMLDDVKAYIKACRPCQDSQVTFCSIPAQLHPIPVKGIWHRLHVDLAGPLPVSASGNRYIIVAVDSLSKWPEAAALTDRTSASTAAFMRDLIARHGCPSEVVTDNGREFMGEFDQLLESHLIDHRSTAPYHPAANGLVERFNRTMITSLERLSAHDSSAWEHHLPTTLMGYRFTKQDSTGHSPYLLMYGRYPVLPGHVMQESPAEHVMEAAEFDSDIQQYIASLSSLQSSALVNVEKAQERQIHSHANRRLHGNPADQILTPADLTPGAYVHYLPPAQGKKRKFAVNALLMRIKSSNKLGTTCVLEDAKGKTVVANIAHISLYHPENS